MTVKLEKKDNNEAILTMEISKEEVKKALDKAFNKIKKQVSVPGFRKGKVPRQIFNNVYGEETLYQEALDSLLPTAYVNALEEVDEDIVGQPQFDIKSMEKNQAWVIEATVSLKPAVKLGEYKGLEVDKQDREVSDEDVNERLESERQRLAELVIKEAAAEEGDTVVIDFEGFLGDEAFAGGKGENHPLVLGSNSFIPGFEEQLIGAEPGAEVDVEVTFPEEYHADELAGKDAVFKVKVHEVKAEELPELDDEFAKDADEEVASLDEYKNKLRVQLEEAKAQEAQDAVEEQALRQAVDNAEVEGGIPASMIEEEVQRQVDYFLNNLNRQGISPDLYYQISNTTEEDLRAQFAEEAELRVKTNLVLETIIKEEGLEASESEIQEETERLAEQYNLEVDEIKNYVSEEMLASDVKMKKAMDMIVTTAKEK